MYLSILCRFFFHHLTLLHGRSRAHPAHFLFSSKPNTYVPSGTPTIFIIKTTAAPSHDHPDATHAFSHDDVHSF